MASLSNNYKSSLRSVDFDDQKGSARKSVELAARGPFPMNSVVAVSQASNATGTVYNQIGGGTGVAALRIWGDNNTGTSLIFKRHGLSGPTKTFASGALIDLPCIANANEWDVKRTDDSNTLVTLTLFGFNVI